MITGIHTMLFTRDTDGTRAFFRDVLGFSSVDAGEGWLIFALPPAELGVHPVDDAQGPELYLMCDDVEATMNALKSRGVEFTKPVEDPGWGKVTALRLPGGAELGLYEPRHPTALGLPFAPGGAKSL